MNDEGLTIDPAKVEGLRDMYEPETAVELCKLL